MSDESVVTLSTSRPWMVCVATGGLLLDVLLMGAAVLGMSMDYATAVLSVEVLGLGFLALLPLWQLYAASRALRTTHGGPDLLQYAFHHKRFCMGLAAMLGATVLLFFLNIGMGTLYVLIEALGGVSQASVEGVAQ